MKTWHVEAIFNQNSLRNWTYILSNSLLKNAYVVDPFNHALVENYLLENELTLKAIFNTHEHWDHVQGNNYLVETFGAEVWAHELLQQPFPGKKLKGDESLVIDQELSLKIFHIPGHTALHLGMALVVENHIEAFFSGDTLFQAGVGNCRSGGDVGALFHTIKVLNQILDDGVTLFPGHDYAEKNWSFFCTYAPEKWVETLPYHLDERRGSTLNRMEIERKTNLFLRTDDLQLRKHLEFKLDTGSLDPFQCFTLLRKLRDVF